MQGLYNPYLQQFQTQIPQNYLQPAQQAQQTQPLNFAAIYVSDIAEVNSTPADQSGNPKYFHNRAKNEIYVKQYDSSGAAPIKTFKLVDNIDIEKEGDFNQKNFKALNQRLDEFGSKIENLYNAISSISTEPRGKKQ